MPFTLVVHHYGIFALEPHPHYRDGKVTTFTDVDLDRWSYPECVDLVKDMGYRAGKFKLWWRTQEDAIAQKFRPVLTDNDAMVLGTYAVDNRGLVHLFVEHEADELPITPLGLLRFMDGTTRPKHVTLSTKNTTKPTAPPKKVAQPTAPPKKSNTAGKRHATSTQPPRRSVRVQWQQSRAKRNNSQPELLILSSDDEEVVGGDGHENPHFAANFAFDGEGQLDGETQNQVLGDSQVVLKSQVIDENGPHVEVFQQQGKYP